MSGPVAARIDRELKAVGTEKRATGEKAYLKSDLEFYGVQVRAGRDIALRVWREENRDRRDLITGVKSLWATGVHESRMAAVELLVFSSRLLTTADVPLIERLLRESKTWALVDPLASGVIGPLDDRLGLAETLERWAADADFWIRRSALLAHLLGLRRGTGEIERFLRFADAMLEESEFFIRRGCGDGVRVQSGFSWTFQEKPDPGARHRHTLESNWLVSARIGKDSPRPRLRMDRATNPPGIRGDDARSGQATRPSDRRPVDGGVPLAPPRGVSIA